MPFSFSPVPVAVHCQWMPLASVPPTALPPCGARFTGVSQRTPTPFAGHADLPVRLGIDLNRSPVGNEPTGAVIVERRIDVLPDAGGVPVMQWPGPDDRDEGAVRTLKVLRVRRALLDPLHRAKRQAEAGQAAGICATAVTATRTAPPPTTTAPASAALPPRVLASSTRYLVRSRSYCKGSWPSSFFIFSVTVFP